MKRLLTGGLAAMLVMLLPGCGDQTTAKPVIYLYPEEVTEVLAQLDYNGELAVTYPAYEDGWAVTAHPDGTLVDAEGKEYSYLFWEGSSDTEYDFSERVLRSREGHGGIPAGDAGGDRSDAAGVQ